MNSRPGDNTVVTTPKSNFDILLEANKALETSAVNIQALREKRKSLLEATSQAPLDTAAANLQEMKKRRSDLLQVSAVQLNDLKQLTEEKKRQVDIVASQVKDLEEKLEASGQDLANVDLSAESITPVSLQEASDILQNLNTRLNTLATENNTAATLQAFNARYTLFFNNAEALKRDALDKKTAENKQATDLLAATTLPVIQNKTTL